MREIKFRAWDKWGEPQKMIYPNGGDFIGWHGPSNWKDCYEVMQFTGLRDKNGKEIYEGDVVITHFPKTTQYEAYTEKGVVVLHWNMFIAATIEDKIHGKNNGVYFHSEVIGNIYENPELIK